MIAAYLLYHRYWSHPWTRDGQVCADVVKIAPRVGGYLFKVNVEDNQFVRKGDLFFQIDPKPYQLAVDKAKVGLDLAREEVAALEAAEAMVAESLVEKRSIPASNVGAAGSAPSPPQT